MEDFEDSIINFTTPARVPSLIRCNHTKQPLLSLKAPIDWLSWNTIIRFQKLMKKVGYIEVLDKEMNVVGPKRHMLQVRSPSSRI